MMVTTKKPTVLFVHGSWHSPAHFKPVMELFEANGFRTSCPCQPSFGSAPTIKMYEDAECIRSEIKKIVEHEGKDLIPVLHSYGGIVGTQAIHESFSKASRQSLGLSGGVLRIVYMCAFLLPLGDSLGSAFGGELPPSITVNVSPCAPLSYRHLNVLP